MTALPVPTLGIEEEMEIDVIRMGVSGWSIRYGHEDGVTEFAYLPDSEGWDRRKVDMVAEILDKAVEGVAEAHYNSGFLDGRQEGIKKFELSELQDRIEELEDGRG